MTPIEEITAATRPGMQIINDLKLKSIVLRSWAELEKEYDPKLHPVITDPSYRDKAIKGRIEKVTRITVDLQRLAAKRMTELMFGIPVKRVYKAETEGEKEVAKVMEKIYQRNRIDAVNIERGTMLNAGCEVVTLWFAIEEKNQLYGIDSPFKLRCKNYSPMLGDGLYPFFDEYDDLKALSFEYIRNDGKTSVNYFDTFTSGEHIQWRMDDSDWIEITREQISIGKIPAIYVTRPTPIWEDTSCNVYEIEWALSRNGNYLRKNSKPNFAIFSDKNVNLGNEKADDFRNVLQLPKDASANYITWPQATDALKFHVENLYKSFFTQLQLPDMSMESMKSTPMSGEARKMVFIDAQLKVTEESGRWIEALDREVNVIKAFLKTIMPGSAAAIDSLQIETQVTPYAISDEKDTIANLMAATGGKPIISQREGVKQLGWSEDVEQTIQEIQKESAIDSMAPTF